MDADPYGLVHTGGHIALHGNADVDVDPLQPANADVNANADADGRNYVSAGFNAHAYAHGDGQPISRAWHGHAHRDGHAHGPGLPRGTDYDAKLSLIMVQVYKPAVVPPAENEELAWWFVFRGSRLLVRIEDGAASLPQVRTFSEVGLPKIRSQYLGRLNERHCYSVEVGQEVQAPEGWTFQGLRRLFGLLPESLFWVAGAAVQIVAWDRNHQICGRCGSGTRDKPKERAKECPKCGLISYPRISPAIIVLVERGDTLLLARSHRHPQGLFSVIAGFVEPGETLEDAVRREIKEEVSIEVRDIRYFGSQPWPFPDSLMIAFTCNYASGDIVLEEEEIAEAGWYRADELPAIPPKISIARGLIDWFISRHEPTAAVEEWTFKE